MSSCLQSDLTTIFVDHMFTASFVLYPLWFASNGHLHLQTCKEVRTEALRNLKSSSKVHIIWCLWTPVAVT